MIMELPGSVSPMALRRARIALEEVTAGPSKAAIAAAPLLRLWQPVIIQRDPCLAGLVTGHPLLRPSYITTSPLIALDPKQAWARTMSRFYQLDQPLPAAIKDALAPDSPQGIQPLDAYGHPAVDLAQVQTYLAALAEFIRAHSAVN